METSFVEYVAGGGDVRAHDADADGDDPGAAAVLLVLRRQLQSGVSDGLGKADAPV